MHLDLPQEYRAWIDRAVAFVEGVGDPGLVLLVGSRGAGYTDGWSDLDLWILGDKGRLAPTDRRGYEEEGQVFRDRGDHEAHWSFFDWDDALARLEAHEPVFTWIATRSLCLAGPKDVHGWLVATYGSLPRAPAERLLRLALGAFVQDSGGGIARAARGDPTAGVAAAGRAIDAGARACLLADRQPYPYGKWLVRTARGTRLGAAVVPVFDEVAAAIGELAERPEDTHFREWTPIARLRGLREPLSSGLAEIGWTGPWVADLGLNLLQVCQAPFVPAPSARAAVAARKAWPLT